MPATIRCLADVISADHPLRHILIYRSFHSSNIAGKIIIANSEIFGNFFLDTAATHNYVLNTGGGWREHTIANKSISKYCNIGGRKGSSVPEHGSYKPTAHLPLL